MHLLHYTLSTSYTFVRCLFTHLAHQWLGYTYLFIHHTTDTFLVVYCTASVIYSCILCTYPLLYILYTRYFTLRCWLFYTVYILFTQSFFVVNVLHSSLTGWSCITWLTLTSHSLYWPSLHILPTVLLIYCCPNLKFPCFTQCFTLELQLIMGCKLVLHTFLGLNLGL